MTNALVLDLAKSLRPEEVEEFRVFLQSSYFNREFNLRDLEALFEVIQNAIENETWERLEKEFIYEEVFPGKPWIRNKLEKLASDLNKMFRLFLLTRQYFKSENESRQQLDWLKELRLRGLTNRYQHALEKTKKEIDKENVESLEHCFLHLQLAREEHEWYSTYNTKGDLKVPELIEFLDTYYFVYRTELLNRLLIQSKHIILDQNALEMITPVWDVPSSLKNQSSILQITYSIHSLLKAEIPAVDELERLLNFLKEKEGILSPEEIKAFYTYLRNLCTLFLNLGNAAINPVLHEIQKDNLERGYFNFEGKILPNACLSITQTAIRIGEIDWAKTFLEQYKDTIFGDSEGREYYRLNLALCLFAEKRYDKALDMLFFEASFSTYHLMARRLELKIYYELNDELLHYKIDAFSMFIRRTGQKVFSKDLYDININFVNMLRQLSLSAVTYDPDRSERLIQRINSKQKLAERPWLLEKAAELGRNNKKTPR